MIPLCDLPRGQTARIVSIAGSDNITQRLLEHGVLEGDDVEIIAVAPLGDPLEIRFRFGCLSLRRTEASRIMVEP